MWGNIIHFLRKNQLKNASLKKAFKIKWREKKYVKDTTLKHNCCQLHLEINCAKSPKVFQISL